MSTAIVIVHGYTGSRSDVAPLHRRLAAVYGAENCTVLGLPGHGENSRQGATPFNGELFIAEIADAVQKHVRAGKKIVLIGHSTGGSVLLSFLSRHSFTPHGIVLAGTPRQITGDCLERWERHTRGRTIPLTDVARMVSLVNSAGRDGYGPFPVLVINGSEDSLVSPDMRLGWEKNFRAPVRTGLVPSGGHDLFRGDVGEIASDMIEGFIDDIARTPTGGNALIEYLKVIEPGTGRFLANSPHSVFHLANCPSARRIDGGPLSLSDVSATGPVFANFEITTKCNMSCAHCARRFLEREEKDMPVAAFQEILGILPHAYRITLVGLGEPLMHPRVDEIISAAKKSGRKVSLVTNAMLLDAEISDRLIDSGLDTLVVSIDTVDQELSSALRRGSDMQKIISNIENFGKMNGRERKVPVVVFSAVSALSAPHLTGLVEQAASLGADAIMMTDLNFRENSARSVHANAAKEVLVTIRKAVARAFALNLPVLGISGLEDFGISHRYRNHLLVPPERIRDRSEKRRNCVSPWQTIAVDVNGDVALCDCQPDKRVGNILKKPFSRVWNGERIREHRREMLGAEPPQSCLCCPRF
jgi:radical SAM protein with 4Fe4S-binding SPASM domain